MTDEDSGSETVSTEFTHVIFHKECDSMTLLLRRCLRILAERDIFWLSNPRNNSHSFYHGGSSSRLYTFYAREVTTVSRSYGTAEILEDRTNPSESKSMVDASEEKTPNYLKHYPKDLLEIFGLDGEKRLGLLDTGFRKLVKLFCGLPAYFGIVLFRRIREYRDITREMVRAGYLREDIFEGSSMLTSSSERSKISLRDFLRVWHPGLQDGTREDKFISILRKPLKSRILAIETDQNITHQLSTQDRVALRDVQPFVEALVDRHPDLHFLKNRPLLRCRYVTNVLVTIGSSLYALCSGTITVKEIQQSNMIDMFYACAGLSVEEVTPFSVERFQKVHSIFVSAARLCGIQSIEEPEKDLKNVKTVMEHGSTLDKAMADRVTITPNSLKRAMGIFLPSGVEKRLFSGRVRSITSGVAGQLNFEDSMWFYVAKEDKMTDFSVEYWFRALDFDDDGYLNGCDLRQCYKEKLELQKKNGLDDEDSEEKTAMIKASDLLGGQLDESFVVSPLYFRKYCIGSVFYDIFLDVRKRRAGRRFHSLSVSS